MNRFSLFTVVVFLMIVVLSFSSVGLAIQVSGLPGGLGGATPSGEIVFVPFSGQRISLLKSGEYDNFAFAQDGTLVFSSQRGLWVRKFGDKEYPRQLTYDKVIFKNPQTKLGGFKVLNATWEVPICRDLNISADGKGIAYGLGNGNAIAFKTDDSPAIFHDWWVDVGFGTPMNFTPSPPGHFSPGCICLSPNDYSIRLQRIAGPMAWSCTGKQFAVVVQYPMFRTIQIYEDKLVHQKSNSPGVCETEITNDVKCLAYRQDGALTYLTTDGRIMVIEASEIEKGISNSVIAKHPIKGVRTRMPTNWVFKSQQVEVVNGIVTNRIQWTDVNTFLFRNGGGTMNLGQGGVIENTGIKIPEVWFWINPKNQNIEILASTN